MRCSFILPALLIFISCHNQHGSSLESSDSILNSMEKAKSAGIQVEGKFVKIERKDDKHYSLYLGVNNDSVLVLTTLMPIDENEIGYLKSDGNNIKLTYTEYNNPVTRKVDKLVQYMEPIYELKKRW